MPEVMYLIIRILLKLHYKHNSYFVFSYKSLLLGESLEWVGIAQKLSDLVHARLLVLKLFILVLKLFILVFKLFILVFKLFIWVLKLFILVLKLFISN